MVLLHQLKQLFKGYNEGWMTFNESADAYKTIVSKDPSFVVQYVLSSAQVWGKEIHSDPSFNLESKIAAIKDFYIDAEKHYRRKEEIGDWDYRKLSYAYWKGTIYYAATLFKECCRINVCADVFFIPSQLIDESLKEIGLYEFDESRNNLCGHCIKQVCPHRVCKAIDIVTENENAALTEDEKKHQEREHKIWQAAFAAGYVDYEKNWISKGHTNSERAVLAHEICARLGIKQKEIMSLWNFKHLSQYYNQATSETKKKIESIFSGL